MPKQYQKFDIYDNKMAQKEHDIMFCKYQTSYQVIKKQLLDNAQKHLTKREFVKLAKIIYAWKILGVFL